MIWHTVPELEANEHQLKIDCDCNPKVDMEADSENILVVHQSYEFIKELERII